MPWLQTCKKYFLYKNNKKIIKETRIFLHNLVIFIFFFPLKSQGHL